MNTPFLNDFLDLTHALVKTPLRLFCFIPTDHIHNSLHKSTTQKTNISLQLFNYLSKGGKIKTNLCYFLCQKNITSLMENCPWQSFTLNSEASKFWTKCSICSVIWSLESPLDPWVSAKMLLHWEEARLLKLFFNQNVLDNCLKTK